MSKTSCKPYHTSDHQVINRLLDFVHNKPERNGTDRDSYDVADVVMISPVKGKQANDTESKTHKDNLPPNIQSQQIH